MRPICSIWFQRTKPGPFGRRTGEMGSYIGMRDRGPCPSPWPAKECVSMDMPRSVPFAWMTTIAGKGLLAGLVNVLRKEIERRSETPFLHVFSDNTSAIGLYQRLGFELRRTFHLTRVGHTDPGSAVVL